MRATDSSTSTMAWRELFRCDDLLQARAVATSIAAMEFDVRLIALDTARHHRLRSLEASLLPIDDHAGEEDEQEFSSDAGPFVIEVPTESWPDLADVLLEIIAEQQEFDERLAWRKQRHQQKLVLVLGIATAAEVLIIWRLLES